MSTGTTTGAPAPGAIRTVGDVDNAARNELRNALLDAYARFAVYRKLFQELKVTREDIKGQDPLDVLRCLPILEGHRFDELVEESITVAGEVIDMETSSGTTGPRKRRVITYTDDVHETELMAQLLGVCGIGASDSVACLDTDPLTLMVSFTKALDHLGVAEAYAYSVGLDPESTAEGLIALRPTAIVTIPSILELCLPVFRAHLATPDRWELRKIVYVGEPLSETTRTVLGSMGVEVFGWYGASETSTLGIECRSHDGVHLFTDRNIIEVATPMPGANVGEIIVTTLGREGLPLLRYALKDLIELKNGACPCGLSFPRVEVMGRTDGTVSVLGAKITYGALLEAAYRDVGYRGPMEAVLTRNAREELTLVLPYRLAGEETMIRKSLLGAEPDLAFLVGSKHMALEMDFVDDSYFDSKKKIRRIVDRRKASDDSRC